MSLLNIDNIIQINVEVSAVQNSDAGFNSGLILGTSGHVTASTRVKKYLSVAEMVEDGFETTDNEYKAAVKYFAQNPAPKCVYIGAQNTDSGSSETLAAAVAACWAKNSEWYGLYITEELSSTTLKAVADVIEDKRICLFFDDDDPDDKDSSESTDFFSIMSAYGVNNIVGVYSTDSFAGAAVMGLAMGLNDGSDNSTFTLAYKHLNNVAVEDLSSTEVATLKGKHANVYVNRSGNYNVFEQGVCVDGTPFDETLALHVITGNIQKSVMDLLIAPTTRKIPYSDEGASLIVTTINNVCARARAQGFVTPGMWAGNTVLALNPGDALTEGYYVQVEPIATQSAASRAGRICPPIYVCLKLAGAIEYAVINVNVDR